MRLVSQPNVSNEELLVNDHFNIESCLNYFTSKSRPRRCLFLGEEARLAWNIRH